MMRTALSITVAIVITVLIVSTGDSQTRSMQADSARDCALCHLDWVTSFDRKDAVLLIDKPAPSIVYNEETCLGCHDGSVDDDRLGVWRHHGHQAGTKVPPGMKVPEELPLQDGRLSCRTCHSAHATGSESLATIVFLRVPTEGGKLCTMCHSDYGDGAMHGSHPLAELPWELPTLLSNKGAETDKDGRTMDCLTCHRPHGAEENKLLVTSDVGELCVACHEKLDPGRYAPDKMSRFHPVAMSRTEDAPDCLSCHQMHGSPAPDHLLNKPLTHGGLCAECHTDQLSVVGTQHDLLKTMPTTHNDLGVAAGEGGTCSACHAVHGQARTPKVTDIDPAGQCTTCHTQGRCAETLALDEHNHPFQLDADAIPADNTLKLAESGESVQSLRCLSCHNPHGTSHVRFMRERPDAICANCHGDYAASVVGAHDIPSGHPDAVNAGGFKASATGRCGFCHAFHGATGPLLWTAGEKPVQRPADTCRNCHQSDGLAREKVGGELRHPAGPVEKGSKASAAGLPLFELDGHDDMVACGTCHDVHANSKQHSQLLRGKQIDSGWAWCGQCHTQSHTIAASLHGERFLREHASDKASKQTFCGPCHSVHAEPGAAPTGMWAGPLARDIAMPESGQCLGCHSGEGIGGAVHVTIHPTVPMHSPGKPGDRGFLPLIDEQGHLGKEGQLTCRTCHLPHGRRNGTLPESADPEKLSEQELSGLKTLLRPYDTPNLCSGCHALEGLGYYMYFHRPEKLLKLNQ